MNVQAQAVKETITISVGDKIIVNHVSDGQGKLVRCKDSLDYIRAVYLDGSVRVGAGDVYMVEPSPGGKAKVQTKWPVKPRG